MLDNRSIKIQFSNSFNEILNQNIEFRHLLYEIFIYGTAYLVGGFFRDVINSRSSRDLDIIIDLNHDKLLAIIIASNINHEINRHNGIKLKLAKIEIDLWSIENNWAFKNKLVKLNEEDKLNSIANGCFYNYDALVINLHSLNFNIKHYKDFVNNNKLEILQKLPIYKNLNPTIEANILRAFFLKSQFGIDYSTNTLEYLIAKLGYLKDKYFDNVQRLAEVKTKYPKYDDILDLKSIHLFVKEIEDSDSINNQMIFKF